MRRLFAYLACSLALHGQMIVKRGPIAAAAGGGGTVTYDAVASGKCGNTGGDTACASADKQLTYAMTVGAGSNRGLAVFVCVSAGGADVQPAISTVTYAGQSLTQKQHAGGNYYCDLWTLADGVQPTSGTNNVTVTLASALVGSASRMTSGAISATGVNQTTAWTSSNGATGSGTSASTTLSSSLAGELVVYSACSGTANGATSGTERWDNGDNTFGACMSNTGATAAGGTTTLTYTVTSDSWVIVGGSFKAQ